MNVIRIRDPQALRPLHVVMIALVLLALAGGSLLLSAAESTELVDGAVAWNAESPLRAVVQLLCLNYQFPTTYAGEVKNYILGVCAGLAVLALAMAVLVRPKSGDDEAAPDLASSSAGRSATVTLRRLHVAPLVAAQVLAAIYLLWSFVSSRWSPAPELAVGESILLTMFFLWSFSLAHGLSSRAAMIAANALMIIGVVMAAVAIWYYYGRNPTLRAKFPIGNPTLLASCLIPPILLAVARAWSVVRSLVHGEADRLPLLLPFVLVALAVLGWAFMLTGSRGPAVGLVCGLLAVAFFEIRGRLRLVPVGAAAVLIIASVLYFLSASQQPSPTGRSETIRFRMYAWSYAWDLFREKPLNGHGQGGFAMLGDSLAVNDVLYDPLVFESRIAHAHNEWLQILADLGAVGIVLIAAVLVMTLVASAHSRELIRPAAQRWALPGLVGSIVGLCASEVFGVGLRTAAVPTYFFTVLGLLWALGEPAGSTLIEGLSRRRIGRAAFGVVGGLAGLFALLFSHQDFADAQSGYRTQQFIEKQQYESGIKLATRAVNRLNVQRALEGWFRLAEANMRIARQLEQRAADRERRAEETGVPELQLHELARIDREKSDEFCRQGSAALAHLLRRSPGYIQHGWVAYSLNVVQSDNAAARGDAEQEDRFLKAATAALERELLREPYEPDIAVTFVGTAYGQRDWQYLFNVVARPLRIHRITAAHVELLRHLSGDPQFADLFIAEARRADADLHSPQWSPEPPRTPNSRTDARDESTNNPWAPEKLRIAAAFAFMRGDLGTARSAIESAAMAYKSFAKDTHMGAAACFAELADCRFLHSPQDPAAALAAAEEALALAPESEYGRALKASIRQRTIEYHLAADREPEAVQLLRESGPQRAPDHLIKGELASRYRQLLSSMLSQRDAEGRLRSNVALLAPKLAIWVARTIELDDSEPVGFVLAAQAAFDLGDDDAFNLYVRAAVSKGLPKEDARNLISRALRLRPDAKGIRDLLESLGDEAAPNHPDGASLGEPEQQTPNRSNPASAP